MKSDAIKLLATECDNILFKYFGEDNEAFQKNLG